MKLNIIPNIINLAKDNEIKIKAPALRVLGNITTSTDENIAVNKTKPIF